MKTKLQTLTNCQRMVLGSRANTVMHRDFLMEPYRTGRGRPDYIGIRRVGQDGFTLRQLHQGMLTPHGIVIEADEIDLPSDVCSDRLDVTRGTPGSSASVSDSSPWANISDAAIDVFSLDGPSCVRDLDITLARLHRSSMENNFWEH